MRRSSILAGIAVTLLVASFAGAKRAAGPARAGRRARMPRRRQHRLHRRLGHQSRLRAARRGHAGRPLCRDHPQGRRRSRHHPGNRRWPGACMRRSPGSGPAISRAITPARRAVRRSASGSAATCWSAARTIRSRCSRSACRARSASMSRPGWKAWNFGREGNRSPEFPKNSVDKRIVPIVKRMIVLFTERPACAIMKSVGRPNSWPSFVPPNMPKRQPRAPLPIRWRQRCFPASFGSPPGFSVCGRRRRC